MKKIFLLVGFLLLAASVVAAQDYTTVEGEAVTLTASSLGDLSTDWSIIAGNLHGYDASDAFFPGTTTTSNTVQFTLPITGTFTVRAQQGSDTEDLVVLVQDSLAVRGFGHQCYAINTSNCVDITAYGSVLATQNIFAGGDIFGNGMISALSSIRVGNNDEVLLSASQVTLPDTVIEGNLNFSGVLHSDSGLITVMDDVEMNESLTVSDTTYLHHVDEIRNPSQPITVDASQLFIDGDFLTDGLLSAMAGANIVGNLFINGDAFVQNNLEVNNVANIQRDVVLEDSSGRFYGAVVLDRYCPNSGTRIYQEGQDTVIELGNC